MAKPQPVVRVFIASPSDCENERQILTEVITQVNQGVARPSGVVLERVAWEDEPPHRGRPQARLNERLDTCDWAIFILNRRWGTPTGEDTSGFSEEFRRASDRASQTGWPHVALFFREVPTSVLEDPGPQLMLNLAFRDDVFRSREYFVKVYRDDDEFRTLVTTYLSQWVVEGNYAIEPAQSTLRDLDAELSRLKGLIEGLSQTVESELPCQALRQLERSGPAQTEVTARQLLLLRDQDPALHSFLAFVLMKQGRYERAVAEYDRAIALSPSESVDEYINRGNALRELGRHEEALASYDRALGLDPKNGAALFNRGNVLQDLNRVDEAIDSYLMALAERLADSDLRNNLGNAYARAGMLDKALDSYYLGLVMTPDDPDLHINLGNALRELGRHEEALQSYDAALELSPNDPRTLYGRGNVLQDLGRYDEAVDDYSQAINQEGYLPQTLSNYGYLLRELGRTDEALELYDRAVVFMPDDPIVHNGRAAVLADLRRYDEALESAQRALAASPRDSQYLTNLAGCLLELGRHTEALAHLEEALRLSPDRPDALLVRALCLRAMAGPPSDSEVGDSSA